MLHSDQNNTSPGWTLRRGAALGLALVAWAGLALQYAQILGGDETGGRSFAAALWIFVRFFTLLTNLFAALVMSLEATGGSRPRRVAALVPAIVLVGAAYEALLRGLTPLAGLPLLADTIVHDVVPLGVVAYWVMLVPKGALRRAHVAGWSLYPVVYLAYALVRAASDGKPVYPFLDVPALGAARVAVNVVVIAAAFVAFGLVVVTLDRRLGPRP